MAIGASNKDIGRGPEAVGLAEPTRERRNVLGPAGWMVFAGVVIALAVGCSLFALHWPFARSAFTRSLEQDSESRVQIGSFRQTYFPSPGCVAENVVFERDPSSPRLTIRRLTVVGSYAGLPFRHIPRVMADGAVLEVPPGGLKELFTNPSPGQHPTSTSVGEIDAPGAVIIVNLEDDTPALNFIFRKLKLSSVSKNSAVRFNASLRIPEPAGDLELSGSIGPFRRGDAGQTPVSGSYSLKNGQLEQFTGVGGVLASEGKFTGELQAITMDGTTETPDFQLDVGVHPVPLSNKFHAVVNATNGDLQLNPVESFWGKTKVITRGDIEGPSANKQRKTAAFQMNCSSGRVQDLLRLFVHDDQSPMAGAITFKANVLIPPGDQNFLRKVRLQGIFEIEEGRYANPKTQQDVDILSARARGQADKIEDDQDRDRKNGTNTVTRDLEQVISNVRGDVTLRDTVATFSHLSFKIPGASALLSGTYNVQTRVVDMRGEARMESSLSEATSGVKSFLLRILHPRNGNKRKPGSVVMVHVTGTYGHLSISAWPTKDSQ